MCSRRNPTGEAGYSPTSWWLLERAHGTVNALQDVYISHQPQSSKNFVGEFLQDWECFLLRQNEGRTVSGVMLTNWVSAHLPATAGLLPSATQGRRGTH